MARLNTYPGDNNVTASDKVLGTDASTGQTKNFELNAVSEWLNTDGAVKIVGQNNYRFRSEGAVPADREVRTISFESFGGDATAFSDITELIFSNQSAGNNNAATYLASLVGKQVLLADLSELANFGVYTLQSFQELDTEPGFYRGALVFVSGNGSIYEDVAYGIAAEGLQSNGSTWGSITGTITDQTDLVDYINAEIAAIPTPETPTLQSVTDAGNTTTNAISAGTITANNELHLVNSQMRIFRSGDNMRIRTGNSDRMTITSTGNVGIGTTSPQQKLHVDGTIRIGSDVDLKRYAGMLYTAQRIVLGAQNSENASITINTNSTYSAIGVRRPSSGTTSILKVRDYSTQDVYVDIDSDGNAYFDGNVGIGTTAPSEKLEVVGNVLIDSTGVLGYKIQDTVNGRFGEMRITGDSSKYFEIRGYQQATILKQGAFGNVRLEGGNNIGLITSGSERIRIDSSGNVGIGTTTPGAKLDVNGTTYLRSVALNTVFGYSGNNIQFINSGNTTFAGNIGIGTTAPTEKLHVSGNIALSDESELYIKGSTSSRKIVRLLNEGDKGLITINRADKTRVSLSSDVQRGHTFFNGLNVNVGIGTSSPTEKLEVGGKIKSSSDILVGLYNKLAWGDGSNYLKFSGGFLNIGYFSDAFKFDMNSSTTKGIEMVADSNFQILGKSNKHILLTPQGTGNVGIGTTAPSEKLDVVGDIASQGIYVDRTHESDGISSPFATLGLHRFYGDANTLYIGKSGNSGTYTALDTQGANIGLTSTNGRVYLKSGGQQLLAQQGALNLGIIQHNAANNNYGKYLSVTNSTNATGVRGRVDINGDLRIVDYSTSSAVEKTKIKNDGSAYFSGNVGIGTTSPQNKLHVYSDTAANIARFESNTTYADLLIESNNGAAYVSARDGNLLLNRAGNNVGIGTDSPSQKLDVSGNVNITGAIYGGNEIRLGSAQWLRFGTKPTLWADPTTVILRGGSGNDAFRYQDSSGNEKLRITSDGKVGIGWTAPPGKLSVNGGSSAGNNETLYIASSAYNGNLLNAANSPHVISLLAGKAETGGANLATGLKLVNTGTETAGGNFTDIRSRAYGEIDKDVSILTNFKAEYRNWSPPTGPNTLTNHYAFYANALSVGANGTVTNNYGIYLNPGTAATNNWGVYQTGGDVDNFFEGKVGIGTNSPAYKLDVSGDIRSSSDLLFTSGTHQLLWNGNNTSIIGVANGYLSFKTGNGTERIRITDSGRVGIGTTSPGGHLHVIDSGNLSNGGIFIENTGNTGATLGLKNTEGISKLFTNNGITTLRNTRTGFSNYSIDVGGRGVKIKEGNGGQNADASAILDIDSTTQGVLFPRMTELQKDSISSPATGLIIYQTDAQEGLYIYKSSGWTQII